MSPGPEGDGATGRGPHHVGAFFVREMLLKVKPKGLQQQSMKRGWRLRPPLPRRLPGPPQGHRAPESSGPSTRSSRDPKVPGLVGAPRASPLWAGLSPQCWLSGYRGSQAGKPPRGTDSVWLWHQTPEAKQTYRKEHRGGSLLLSPEGWGVATTAGNRLPDLRVTPDLGPQEYNGLNEVVCACWPLTDLGLKALHQLSGNFPDSQATSQTLRQRLPHCQHCGSKEPMQPPSDPVLGAAAVPSTPSQSREPKGRRSWSRLRARV